MVLRSYPLCVPLEGVLERDVLLPFRELCAGLRVVVGEEREAGRPSAGPSSRGLLLLGHVASPYRVVRAIQRVVERWLLPVAGGLLFTLLIVAVLTSAVWYVGEKGWPSRV